MLHIHKYQKVSISGKWSMQSFLRAKTQAAIKRLLGSSQEQKIAWIFSQFHQQHIYNPIAYITKHHLYHDFHS